MHPVAALPLENVPRGQGTTVPFPGQNPPGGQGMAQITDPGQEYKPGLQGEGAVTAGRQ